MAIFLQPSFWKELFNFNNRKNWLNLDEYIIKIQNKFFPIKKVSVNVSAAQCATAYSDPVELIASPGPGKAIKMLSVAVKKNSGSTSNYTTLFLIAGYNVFTNPGNIPYGFADVYYSGWFYPLSQAPLSGLYIFENDPIVLGAFVDDNSGDGSFEIRIDYQIISV